MSLQVAAGNNYTCAIKNGGAYCWGSNNVGQLGDGTNITRTEPTKVLNLDKNVTKISAKHEHTCAIKDGALFCWGAGGLGRTGLKDGHDLSPPKRVEGLTRNVKEVGVGGGHTCVIQDDNVKCFGWNALGQLGNGNKNNSFEPVLALKGGVTKLSVGKDSACAIQNDILKCWGYNKHNHTKLESNEDVLLPERVFKMPGQVKDVSVGDIHTCAISSGGVYCFGSNSGGKLGDGALSFFKKEKKHDKKEHKDNREHPFIKLLKQKEVISVSGLNEGVTSIDSSDSNTCAIKEGSLKCWGNNMAGFLFLKSRTDTNFPDDVIGVDFRVKQIASGFNHRCVISSDDKLYCWGYNGFGQIGNKKASGAQGATLVDF